ncbi:hypothetical protein M23134_02038 [Microscilla marina ATCC 23134]|uniref:Capsule polysaccharide biosynthesis protein n=1 Tax=Microscilla marina ATCC 23134 TaxID=313606 RepID=A1ZCK7_MICM2|nr:hypothetical protein M23134_02038 [Microscilla marina ATCC 23134]
MPRLTSSVYNSFHVTVNLKEKQEVEELGGIVVGCFEEEFDQLDMATIPHNFLQSSFQADRFMGWLTLEERQEILGKSISFWNRILSERIYFAGVHETIAIEQEEVFSLMLKAYNVLDLNFLVSVVPKQFIWKPDPYSSSYPEVVLEQTPITEANLSLAKEIISKTKQKGHKPSFISNPPKRLKKSNTRHFFSQIKYEIKKRLKLVKSFSREEKKRDSVFYYNQLGTHFYYYDFVKKHYPKSGDYDDLDNLKAYKKIFFPFHFEPEATLLYFNPDVAEQLNTIQQIAKQLPLDTVLLVKEHPYQPGYLLQEEYQTLRKKNSNIAFLPAELDSHSILKQTKAVITICGSVGWEALINNIPVIVLGNVFYDRHPDIHKVANFKEVKEVLDSNILNMPDDKNTIEYLAKFIAHNSRGNPSNEKIFNDPENIKNLTNSIKQKIQYFSSKQVHLNN